jgi:hypothetical protein
MYRTGETSSSGFELMVNGFHLPFRRSMTRAIVWRALRMNGVRLMAVAQFPEDLVAQRQLCADCVEKLENRGAPEISQL